MNAGLVQTEDGPFDAAQDGPRPKERMHISVPEARDFLTWLARKPDGVGDAWNYSTSMRRLHPNNGASSARDILDQLGVPGARETDGPGAAVRQFNAGETEGGKESSCYKLRDDVARFVRMLMAEGKDWQIRSKSAFEANMESLRARYEIIRARPAIGTTF